MELKYNGQVLSEPVVKRLLEIAEQYNILPSLLITQLHFETMWGSAQSAVANNNLGGMTWTGDPKRPSGIIVSRGTARPTSESGYYMRYASVDDFLTDWAYLLRPNGIYKVSGKKTFSEAVKGLFKVGGATYDYAASGYDHYISGMMSRRNAINNANGGALDTLDAEFLQGGKTMAVTADKLIAEAVKLRGINESSSAFRALIDEYNTIRPLPMNYKVKYTDDWCDVFVTVIAKRVGASDLVGAECGVQRHIAIFKQKNIWLGRVRPKKGDIIVWDWQGYTGGWADHIGYVQAVDGDWVTTIEGNTNERVGSNRYKWNDSQIVGYARPKYGTTSVTPEATAKNEKKVSQHFVVTIDNLRAFSEPTATSEIVENIKKNYVKNIDVTIESEGYLWGGWISSADGKRRWTTLHTLEGDRKFVDIKDKTIPHGGKTYEEYLKLQDQVAEEQPVGGDAPKVGKGQVEIDGTVYNVELTEK